MFIFTLKETGETFVLPTPDDKEVKIDILDHKPRKFANLSYFWWRFKKHPGKRQFIQLIMILLVEIKCLFLAGRTTDEI